MSQDTLAAEESRAARPAREARHKGQGQWALNHREITPIYDRGDPTVTGLPGSAAQGTPTDAREELRGFQKERITNV